MGCSPTFPRMQLLAVSAFGHRLPLAPLFPEALKGWAFPFPSIPLLGCLGWRGLVGGALLPSLAAWLAGIGLPGLAYGVGFPSGNGPKRFLKKTLARCGILVPINTQQGENRRAKHKNRNETHTRNPSLPRPVSHPIRGCPWLLRFLGLNH